MLEVSDAPLRRCSTCPEDDQWHPATPEFFVRNKSKKGGLDTICKKCNRLKVRAWQNYYREINSSGVNVARPKEKRCHTCKTSFPATSEFFDVSLYNKDGLVSKCKACTSKRLKEYYRRPLVRETKLAYEKMRRSLPEVQERTRVAHRRRYHRNLAESRRKGRFYAKASRARNKGRRTAPLPVQALLTYQVLLPQEVPQETSHYTYVLEYPQDYSDRQLAGTIFYVGKGMKARINDHEHEAKRGVTDYKCNVIRKIWREDKRVVKRILAFFATHEEAIQYEIALIFFMDGLTNRTSGGEGVTGLKRSVASRLRISQAQMGRRRGSPSYEHRRHISEAKKGKPSPLKGRSRGPCAKETRLKISASKMGSIPWNKGKSLCS